MRKVLLIASVLVLIGAGCAEQSKTWTGFYYPDGCVTCQEDWKTSPAFDTRDACFDWAYNLALESNYEGDDLFECGSNCERDYSLNGMHVCEETFDDALPVAQKDEPSVDFSKTPEKTCYYKDVPMIGDCLHAGETPPQWAKSSDQFVHCYYNDKGDPCSDVIQRFCNAEIALMEQIESEMPSGLSDVERF